MRTDLHFSPEKAPKTQKSHEIACVNTRRFDAKHVLVITFRDQHQIAPDFAHFLIPGSSRRKSHPTVRKLRKVQLFIRRVPRRANARARMSQEPLAVLSTIRKSRRKSYVFSVSPPTSRVPPTAKAPDGYTSPRFNQNRKQNSKSPRFRKVMAKTSLQ